MQEDNCPICELIHNRTQKSMEAFLYESVNDPALRSQICNSNGLCNFHAYMLMDNGDPLAHALIYNDLLEMSIKQIKRPIINKKPEKSYQSHPDCLFCRQEKAAEDVYIKCFIEAFNDNDFCLKYEQQALLCLPHLELIKEYKNTDKIIETTLQKYKSLMGNLMEIKRKNDYRFSGEPWTEEEKAAWKKAVSVVNAKRGLKK
ncbi:MAG: DUF6062 family protein [Oscillospiraceae bacterium]|nr:DUF6062 family protein [Oscillospiraceae bacterium]